MRYPLLPNAAASKVITRGDRVDVSSLSTGHFQEFSMRHARWTWAWLCSAVVVLGACGGEEDPGLLERQIVRTPTSQSLVWVDSCQQNLMSSNIDLQIEIEGDKKFVVARPTVSGVKRAAFVLVGTLDQKLIAEVDCDAQPSRGCRLEVGSSFPIGQRFGVLGYDHALYNRVAAATQFTWKVASSTMASLSATAGTEPFSTQSFCSPRYLTTCTATAANGQTFNAQLSVAEPLLNRVVGHLIIQPSEPSACASGYRAQHLAFLLGFDSTQLDKSACTDAATMSGQGYLEFEKGLYSTGESGAEVKTARAIGELESQVCTSAKAMETVQSVRFDRAADALRIQTEDRSLEFQCQGGGLDTLLPSICASI